MVSAKRAFKVGALASILAALTGCAILAPFNQYSFDETARLEREAHKLLGKAREPYRLHDAEARSVLEGVNRAYQDASIRTKNQASMRYWEVLRDSTQESLAGTLRHWRHDDTLSKAAIELAKARVTADFDAITKLEGKKGR